MCKGGKGRSLEGQSFEVSSLEEGFGSDWEGKEESHGRSVRKKEDRFYKKTSAKKGIVLKEKDGTWKELTAVGNRERDYQSRDAPGKERTLSKKREHIWVRKSEDL